MQLKSVLPLLLLPVLYCAFCFLLCNRSQAVITLPKNTTIPAVFTFGDSILDTGNNNYLETLVKSNFLPYGMDFLGGKPTGRFSNGKVPSDLIESGIKELLPAYLDPSLRTEDLLTGVNFASGCAGFDPLTSELVLVLSLSDQLQLFKEYIKKMKGIIGVRGTITILNNSLFIVVAGNNDLANKYFRTPLRLLQDVHSYTDLLVSSASFLEELYEVGARRVGVFSVPPIGCSPAQLTLAGGIERECVETYNEEAQLFNTKVAAELDILNNHLPHARMAYMDAYNPILDIIHNPEKYEFEVADRGVLWTGFYSGRSCHSCVKMPPGTFFGMVIIPQKKYTRSSSGRSSGNLPTTYSQETGLNDFSLTSNFPPRINIQWSALSINKS